MFIVAEISANHQGRLDMAIETIRAAADAGADAVKIQTFIPEKMAIPNYKIKNGNWASIDLQSLYKIAHTPFKWHKKLFEVASEIGITIFSTPFDKNSLELLESLDCPIYKVASYELIDLQLIGLIASTGKPLIISTGMASKREIGLAVKEARKNGCESLTLLHCISEYPARYQDMNIKTMVDMMSFRCGVGLSDHTIGNTASIVATSLGAGVIEKHITLKKEGLDSKFSLEPHEFKEMVIAVRKAEKALGHINYGHGDKSLRRSLYYAREMQAGDIVTHNDLKTPRPALGLSPLYIDKVIGRPLKKSVKLNEPASLTHCK